MQRNKIKIGFFKLISTKRDNKLGSKLHDWRGKVEEWRGICPSSISAKKGSGEMLAKQLPKRRNMVEFFC